MGYVVAFAGRRDSYQVPIALAEAGLLDALCTDLYFKPDSVLHKVAVPRRFRRRHSPQLDRATILTSLSETVAQAYAEYLGGSQERLFGWVAVHIGRRAARAAISGGSDALLYSNYALETFSAREMRGRRKLLFCYHPHQGKSISILREDLERFPICQWSYDRETRVGDLLDRAHQSGMEARPDREMMLADHVICSSTFSRRSIEESGYCDVDVSVVPYGCDTTHFDVDLSKRSSTQTRFLFVGQGVQRKGLHHLLLAWREARLTNAVLELVLSSADPGILSLVPEGVVLRKMLSHAELSSSYQRSDVFVMPSLVEGFGLVFLEALAAGCFCIFTENTGMPDLHPPGSVGRQVHQGDVSELAVVLSEVHHMVQSDSVDPFAARKFANCQTWEKFRLGILDAVTSLARTPKATAN